MTLCAECMSPSLSASLYDSMNDLSSSILMVDIFKPAAFIHGFHQASWNACMVLYHLLQFLILGVHARLTLVYTRG